jgi:hypothetical protein
MTYIVTLDPGLPWEVATEITDEDFAGVLDRIDSLDPGQAIQIRRAGYLDIKEPEDVEFNRPKLTLLRGGKQ